MMPIDEHTALLIIDVQNDFCPGGSLAVPDGDGVVAPLNRVIPLFLQRGLPIIASRDWHPAGSRHFATAGGIWPPHCVQETPGAAFHRGLELPDDTIVISKGMGVDDDAYSAFQGVTAEGTPLPMLLKGLGVTRLLVGGLATDYCVRASVLDGLQGGLTVMVLREAIRGVDLKADDSRNALAQMQAQGAILVSVEDLAGVETDRTQKSRATP
jgi:nicotinamidase/pyrazinamidase